MYKLDQQTHFIYAAFLIILTALAVPSYAYIDPGTGSYMVQVIIASVASFMLFFVKPAMEKVKRIFKLGKTLPVPPKNDNEQK